MLKIYCDNSRCRLYGIDLDADAVEPLPDTCLSCRRKLTRDIKLDMGLSPIMTPQLWSPVIRKSLADGNTVPENRHAPYNQDAVEDDDRPAWGKSIVETIVEAGKALDEADVPTEDRVLMPTNDIVEWMEQRDSINESFINLIGHAKYIGALYMESRLLELNRELLTLISSKIDEDDDDEFYRLMP